MGLELFHVLRTLHITGAALWAGGGVFMLVFWNLERRRGQGVQFLRDLEHMVPRFLVPAVLLLVASGIWMVLDSPFISFGDWWVSAGLTLLIVSFGIGVADPYGRKALKLADAHGDEAPDVTKAVTASFWLTVFETVLLWTALAIMVLRHSF